MPQGFKPQLQPKEVVVEVRLFAAHGGSGKRARAVETTKNGQLQTGSAHSPCLLHRALLPQGILLSDKLREVSGFPAPSAHSLNNKWAERPTLAATIARSAALQSLVCHRINSNEISVFCWQQYQVVHSIFFERKHSNRRQYFIRKKAAEGDAAAFQCRNFYTPLANYLLASVFHIGFTTLAKEKEREKCRKRV